MYLFHMERNWMEFFNENLQAMNFLLKSALFFATSSILLWLWCHLWQYMYVIKLGSCLAISLFKIYNRFSLIYVFLWLKSIFKWRNFTHNFFIFHKGPNWGRWKRLQAGQRNRHRKIIGISSECRRLWTGIYRALHLKVGALAL